MNRSTNTTAAACTSTHIVSPHNLSMLSVDDLVELYCATYTIRETAFGLASQPRFNKPNMERNGAGDEFEALCEHIGELVQSIVDVVEAARPTDPEEAEKRAFLLIRHEAQCRDSVSRVAAIAAQLSDDVMVAERASRIRRVA